MGNEVKQNPPTGEELQKFKVDAERIHKLDTALKRSAEELAQAQAPLKKEREEIVQRMLNILLRDRDPRTGKASIAAGPITAYLRTVSSAKVEDPLALRAAVESGDLPLDIFKQTVDVKVAQELVAQRNPDLPEGEFAPKQLPGITLSHYQTMAYRAS